MCNHKGRPTHGLYKTSPELYRQWEAMIQRCRTPTNGAYRKYGANGITVCDEWQKFPAFHAWAMANGWLSGLSIDRKDNRLGYSPENCRWLTRSMQAGNRRVKRNAASGFKGVSKANQKWLAMICVNGVRKRLGRFINQEDAARAYDDAAREAFGEAACVNFPREGEACCLRD